jgi:hypothetical protein
MTKQEPAIKRDLVEVIEEVLSAYDAPTFCSKEAAQAVIAALAERGQVMREGGQKIHVNFPFLVLQMESE